MRITPLDLYLKILATWRDAGGVPSGATDASEALQGLAPFQRDGAARLLYRLQKYGGALLCDSPGLGKTHVALAVVQTLEQRGVHALAVLPASLVPMWQAVASRRDQQLPWVTHEALGRCGAPPDAEPAELIVVDEAHAFRNAATRSYRRLAGLCSGRRVLLLTATPVNNRPEDLYPLLRLFCGDRSFADLGVPNLRDVFRAGATCAEDAAAILNRVMVRRTREDVVRDGAPRREECGPRLSFPTRKVSLLRASSDLDRATGHRKLVALLASRARRWPLLVSLLAKRLASSPDALRRTAERLAAWCRLARDRERSGLPPPSRRELETALGEDGGVQALLPFRTGCPGMPPEPSSGERGLPTRLSSAPLPLRTAEPRNPNAAPRMPGSGDLPWLEAVVGLARQAGDARAEALERLLSGKRAGLRTVVFSEYRDTARALYRRLRHLGRVAYLDGDGGRTAAGAATRREILERFAPVAMGRPGLAPHDELRLLIATDVLSEGLNLQDAERVVSYDLPWNPVRLIQRAGRVDRLGSPHDAVRIVLMAPDPLVDRLLRLTARLAAKDRASAATIGPADGRALPGHVSRGKGGVWARAGFSPSRRLAAPPAGRPGGTEGLPGIEPGGASPEPGAAIGESRAQVLETPCLQPAAASADSILGNDLAAMAAGAPRALARSARLPDGLVTGSLPDGAPLRLVVCTAILWPGAPRSVLEWFVVEADGHVQPGHPGDCFGLVRAAASQGFQSDGDFHVPAGWGEVVEKAALGLARRRASRGAGAGERRLRPLVALVQQLQRDCAAEPARLAELEHLERFLAGPLDAGAEDRIADVLRGRLTRLAPGQDRQGRRSYRPRVALGPTSSPPSPSGGGQGWLKLGLTRPNLERALPELLALTRQTRQETRKLQQVFEVRVLGALAVGDGTAPGSTAPTGTRRRRSGSAGSRRSD